MADHHQEKPSSTEDDYFAHEEIEKKHRMTVARARELAAKHKEELKQLHWMKCPRCGMDLHALQKGKIEVEMCFNCHGIWLDSGNLERLMKGEAGQDTSRQLVGAVMNIFKRWGKP